MLEVSDIVKNNSLKLLTFTFQLTLPFQVKSIYLDNQQYYRYSIKKKIPYWKDGETDCYVFDTNEKKSLKVVLFEAK